MYLAQLEKWMRLRMKVKVHKTPIPISTTALMLKNATSQSTFVKNGQTRLAR